MKNIDLFTFFSRNRQRLKNQEWLSRTLSQFCESKRQSWSGGELKAMQHPDEFARWLIILAREKIQTYLEIGINFGGSFYITDSYLRAAVPGFRKSIGIDISQSNLLDWAPYRQLFPKTEVRIIDPKQPLRVETVDAILIDGDHSEAAVTRDFEAVKNSARIIGFHDAASSINGIHPVVLRLKRHYRIEEFSSPAGRRTLGFAVLFTQ
jgi:cephalosporin hydroxylase